MISDSITKGFIYSSVVLFILSMFTTDNFAFHSRMVAYTTLIAGLILTFMPVVSGMFSTIEHMTFGTIAEQVLPFMLSIASVMWLMALHLVHKSNIVNGAVSNSYIHYANLSSLLLIFIIWLLEHTKNGQLMRKFAYLSILSNVFTIACISILYIILVFYTTDG
jgi:hypothetical protein